MPVTFQRETYEQTVTDIQPLLVAHWKEVANYQEEIPLEPDWARYQVLEKAGALVILTCRKDLRLIGYSVFILHRHVHYKSCLVGSNDVLFLDAGERKSGSGIRLIKESEKLLKSLGVHRITWHVKPVNDFSPLLRRLGCMQEEVIMGKLL